ncbi:hypothetical protein NDU88_004750 [Pleurodeles waltl]|uniref:Uncharacterized protein n=1 Tax=Pleurodeles waltl TaxID=8319 RepID=A0AAV7VH41_PLEWA|nr:hypothetical protein NDU88_004750 [Pleurodeles waltl]
MTPARPGAIHPRCRWSRLQSPGWPLFRRDGWCVALGAAPAAPVGLLRSGPVKKKNDVVTFVGILLGTRFCSFLCDLLLRPGWMFCS